MAADNNNDDTQSHNGQPSNHGGEEEGNSNGAALRNGNGRGAYNIQRDANIRRRRHHHNPYPRNPPARVIRGYNEVAYISDPENEEEKEYLPMPARRRGEGGVVHRLQQQQQQQESATKIEEETNNDASPLSKMFAGWKRNARCHCFDCWKL